MNDNTIGSLVPIYGIASPDLGCSCEHHAICDSLVHIDMLVRFKKMVVYSDNNNYKTVMAAAWVTEGSNRCVIGLRSSQSTFIVWKDESPKST
ncbi:hypothetical protein IV203_007971 [Nitzschia inconspicua]|uniref:Uncharacterized protein n=1 Tax=Nitzschia inconspicua TaxID=303405 RepID=A0A9K3KXZ3_9STRA|nr:hypothetical protein IV203_007971 [Nitzschia inconspicua]